MLKFIKKSLFESIFKQSIDGADVVLFRKPHSCSISFVKVYIYATFWALRVKFDCNLNVAKHK